MKKIIFITLVFLSSCSLAPTIEKKEIKTPENFSTQMETISDSILTKDWWKNFNDPILNAFVDSLVKNNLDYKIATARVKQFEALFDVQTAARYPQLNLTGSGRKQDGVMINNFGFSIPGKPSSEYFEINSEQYTLKTGLAFQIDLFGKFKSISEAANNNLLATKYDLIQAYESLVAQAVQLYYRYQMINFQYEDALKNEKSFQKTFKLQEKRYKNGTRPKRILEGSRQQYLGAKIQREQLEINKNNTAYALALLFGKYPSFVVDVSKKIPEMKEFTKIKSIVPSSMLKRRADIMAATHRLEAARYSIGAARADYFPQLSLSADAGFIGKEIMDLFTGDLDLLDKTLTLGVSQSLFSGFSVSANVDQKWAEYEIAALNYEKTVLNAFRDVEKSLMNLKISAEIYEDIQKQLKSTEELVKISRKRYKRGIQTFEDYLMTERSYLATKNAFFSIQYAYIQARIEYFLSIGFI